MPTGYTAELMKKGMPFEKFVMTCARAFGALITMRDEPLSAPIKEFKPSDYHLKEIDEAKNLVRLLENMNSGERITEGNNLIKMRQKDVNRCIAKETKENAFLEDMEKQVREWTPPSSEHRELRTFMLDQIMISKNNVTYWKKELSKAMSLDPMSEFCSKLARAYDDIVYHEKEYAEEVERVNGRNKWIKQLKDSLRKGCHEKSN